MWKRIFIIAALLIADTHAGNELLTQIDNSGRCATIPTTADAQIAPIAAVPPGAPPLLSFRRYEGQQHNRFVNMDLLLDDAGH